MRLLDLHFKCLHRDTIAGNNKAVYTNISNVSSMYIARNAPEPLCILWSCLASQTFQAMSPTHMVLKTFEETFYAAHL